MTLDHLCPGDQIEQADLDVIEKLRAIVGRFAYMHKQQGGCRENPPCSSRADYICPFCEAAEVVGGEG